MHTDTPSPPSFQPPLRHIWIISGPAGSGKSTIGSFLAEKLHLPYIEGDDFHPPQNIEKMSSGTPLTDDDRWGWLATLRDKAADASRGCVVTCSCLKRRYRDFIRAVEMQAAGVVVVRFMYLSLSKALVMERVRERKGHFFKVGMVQSQYVDMEEPVGEQDVVFLDASGSREGVRLQALQKVVECMVDDGMGACSSL